MDRRVLKITSNEVDLRHFPVVLEASHILRHFPVAASHGLRCFPVALVASSPVLRHFPVVLVAAWNGLRHLSAAALDLTAAFGPKLPSTATFALAHKILPVHPSKPTWPRLVDSW